MFQIQHDMLRPGRMVIHHPDPSALAAVPDAIAQSVAPQGTTCSLWALHHAEQDGVAMDAYQHERAELGAGARYEVIELVRPRQARVIWTDRFHLLATGAPASVASRILGLYVGSMGDAIVILHHPSASAQVIASIQALPNDRERTWDHPGLTGSALFVAQVDRNRPGLLEAFVTPALLQPANAALHQLGTIVGGAR